MQTNAKQLLQVQTLSARIGRQVILDRVDLAVDRGECVAVVGGSGAGKSTLLRCLMGLTKPARPFAGKLIFGDRETDFARTGAAKRVQGIAYVPQNPDHGFDPLKRLRWQWRQAARTVLGKTDFTAAQQDLLSGLGLRDFGRCYPHEWSRGMQQRLLVAMALLGKPDLLILDEPTSALDPLIAAQVLRSVMTYAKEHEVAILIVTHDLSLAAKYANRTAIMNSGRTVEFGSTRLLLETPQSDYGRLLVSHRNWRATGSKQSNPSIAAE